MIYIPFSPVFLNNPSKVFIFWDHQDYYLGFILQIWTDPKIIIVSCSCPFHMDGLIIPSALYIMACTLYNSIIYGIFHGHPKPSQLVIEQIAINNGLFSGANLVSGVKNIYLTKKMFYNWFFFTNKLIRIIMWSM